MREYDERIALLRGVGMRTFFVRLYAGLLIFLVDFTFAFGMAFWDLYTYFKSLFLYIFGKEILIIVGV